MAKQVQLRRGTTAEHAAFTGVEGELTIDTTKDTIVVHDAYQVGGFPLLREDLNNLANGTVAINKMAIGSSTALQVARVNAAGNAVEFADPQLLGWGYKHFTGRQAASATSYFTNFTLNYTKKIADSRLVLTTFLYGESSDHDHRLSVWNSVDGYFSENGYEEGALKIDEGGYTSSDVNSTPGTAHHTAVTSKIAAGTNVEFRWYVKNHTVVIGGSYNTSGTSWEHGACWMVVQELYDGS